MIKSVAKYGFLWSKYDWVQKNNTIPNEEGVYLVYCKDTLNKLSKLMYVGTTQHLRTRMAGHIVVNQLKQFCSSHHYFYLLFTPFNNYFTRKRIEATLINRLNPMCNIQRNGFKRERHGYGNCYSVIGERIKLFFNHTALGTKFKQE